MRKRAKRAKRWGVLRGGAARLHRTLRLYARAEECVCTYAQLCVAFRSGARKKSKVMAFLSPEERPTQAALVSYRR